MHQTTPAEDDQLPPLCNLKQRLCADSIIVARVATDEHRTSASDHTNVFIMMDQYTGFPFATALTKRTREAHKRILKFFVGPGDSPDIMVKSDAAGEITSAVAELNWHPEPSLENRWPHNAALESMIGTFKSVVRASMLQSGFPQDGWDCCIPHASLSLGTTKKARILPHNVAPQETF